MERISQEESRSQKWRRQEVEQRELTARHIRRSKYRRKIPAIAPEHGGLHAVACRLVAAWIRRVRAMNHAPNRGQFLKLRVAGARGVRDHPSTL